jgi:hypothetical protein
MAFDEGLAQRIRDCMHQRAGITERKMFVGVTGDFLMARVGPLEYEPALKRPHIRDMDFTGKPMTGYVYVDAPALESDRELLRWVETCLHFVASLSPKAAKPRSAQRP